MNTHYSKYNNMLLLALYTGMRIGEVLALTINDFNFDEDYGTINVNKTLTKNKSGKVIVGNITKTKNGKRMLHLDKVSKGVDLIENIGSGVLRILDAYDKSCFKYMEHFLRVSFKYKENPFDMMKKSTRKPLRKPLRKLK